MKRPRVEGNDICKKVEKPCKNDSDVMVITQKPTDDNKKSDKKNTEGVEKQNDVNVNDKKKMKEEEKGGGGGGEGEGDEEEKRKNYHNNPAYVPDADETKKQD